MRDGSECDGKSIRKGNSTKWALCLLLIGLLLMACAGRPEAETGKSVIEATAVAPEPTATSRPTATPTATPTMTPVADATVQLFPEWEEGEMRTLQIVKQNDSAGGVVSRMPVELVVLEENDDGYLLQWRHGSVEIEGIEIEENSLASRVQQLSEGIILEYQVNERGEFVHLRNWEEVMTLQEQAAEEILNALDEEAVIGDDLAAIRAFLEELLPKTQAEVEAQALEEVRIYHSLYGLKLEQDAPSEYDALLPNLLGGEPLPATGVTEIVSYSPERERATVRSRLEVDSELARDFVLEMLAEANRALGQSPPAEDELPEEIKIVTWTTYSFDLGSGWPTSIRVTRLISVDSQQRQEITRIMDTTE